MEAENTQKKDLKLSYRKLSPEKKKEILRLQNKNNEDSYIFADKLPILYWILIVLSAGWIGYLFYSSQNILWDEWVFWLNLGLTVVAVPVLAFSLLKVLSFFLGKKKDGLIFTPNEFFKVRGDLLRVWNLQGLDSVRVIDDEDVIEVWSDETEVRIKLADSKAEEDARTVQGLFDQWKPLAKDDFLAGLDEKKMAFSSSLKMLLLAGIGIVSVLAAIGMSYSAKNANINYDDDVTFRMAEKIGTIDELEKYKVKYPQGRHIAKINEKVSANLGKIRDDYAAREKESADSEAVEALKEILDETTKSAERKIYVKVSEKMDLDDEVIKKMEKQVNLRIEPYFSVAPENGLEFRKGKVLSDLKLAFRDIAKEGAIEFVLDENPPEDKPLIEVDYVIKSVEMYLQAYFFAGGKRTISYKPGLEYDFDFSMKSGSGTKEYKTEYSVTPKTVKFDVYDERDAENFTFDKKLFSAGSEDFTGAIGEKFGLKE